jgi:putative ABC transport system permease protein
MLGRDLLHAARGLRKDPAFALTSIATIALGIGASTAIFSVVNAVLLQPLPYRDAGRLALIQSDLRRRNVFDFPFSGPDFDDLRHQTTQFQEIAAVASGRVVVNDERGEPSLLINGIVTPNFFRVLGARVVLGRDFTEADATPQPPPGPGSAPASQTGPPVIVILSNSL